MQHPDLDASAAVWRSWVDYEFPHDASVGQLISAIATLEDLRRVPDRELAAEAAQLYFRQGEKRGWRTRPRPLGSPWQSPEEAFEDAERRVR